MFHFPSPKPLHGFHRANSETISTVDAVALVNLAGNRIADTALGTDTVTTLTTNALIRIDTVAGLVDFFTTESKTLAVGRELGEIEVFSLRLIDMEYLKRLLAFFSRIDFCHIRIFFKNLPQPFLADIPHSTPDGDRNRGEGIRTFHTGEGHERAGHQAVVEGLPFGGQKIEAVFVSQHQVDHTGLRQARIVHGGKHGRVNILLQNLKNVLRCHVIMVHNTPSEIRIEVKVARFWHRAALAYLLSSRL